MNIVTGQIAHPDANTDNALILGHRATWNFKFGWPDSLCCPLGKLGVAMYVKKNHLLVGKERVYDQELLYARVIGLFACSREMNFSNVLAFELAAYPLSMFNADGKINVAPFKSTLKYKLQATVSEHNCPISARPTMIMMSALLWVITCPSGKLRAYVDTFKAFVHQALRRANVILVFGRYFPNGIKTFTTTQTSGSSRVYKLTTDMLALANQVVLTITKNKIQLNAMLTESILDPGYFTESTQTHTLTIAGVRDVPVEITGGLCIDRRTWSQLHAWGGWYPNRTTRWYLAITLRQVCSYCLRRHIRVCPTRSLLQVQM